MLTRDFYIATLEKRAAEEAPNDSQETALSEFASNMKDNRAYLTGIFDNAGAVEKTDSREAGKLFPGKTEKESGYVFMKVARALFDEALVNAETNGLLKTASPAYREVAFHAFCEELEKIAVVAAPSVAAHQATLRAGTTGMGAAPKTWHIPDPDAGTATAKLLSPGESAGLSPTVRAMREASAAKAAKPGLLSRAMGALGFGK
jgi:hypothetical protein